MLCAWCQNPDSSVLETRRVGDGSAIRRRRQCDKCEVRWTTIEVLAEVTTPAPVHRAILLVPHKQGRP